MAAGGSSKASAGALEASLDRKMQSVTNTMDSIQSLSSWCIENKKYHSTVVHHWLKWFRRSGFGHRLNLFYLANDVIQNCKRKNAIVYREAFAEVLPEAASLVKDASVAKSVERIFKIWEERNVYQEDVIANFRSSLNKKDGSSGKRSRSSRPKPEKVQEAPPVTPKAALKSKIVAEFRPQKLIDDLQVYKRSVDNVKLKEQQLSNMRVDVCSTETLKRLKDKAGGKKFSKDFEEASAKLEEFVGLLEKQVRNGPPLTEALENAGIFYEAQYREVKVVVNAYKTFANRVNNLKKKLDQLKATLPDPEESPVPSPTIDAPSPTGSESPFQGMGDVSPLSPEVEPIPPISPEPPKDNRMVEDMELSDVDADEEVPDIIVEERKEAQATSTLASDAVTTSSTEKTNFTTAAPASTPAHVPASLPTPAAVSVSAPVSAPAPTVSTSAKTVTTPTAAQSASLGLPNLANVDLGKISSILSSLTSVMKTGVSPGAKPSPGTPTTPTTSLGSGLKTPVQIPQNPLANILSKVEITPESILSALSKTQGPSTSSLQGLSSLIQSVAVSTAQSSGALSHSTSTAPVNSTVPTMKDRNAPSVTPPFVSKNFDFSPNSTNTENSSTSLSKTSVGHSSNLKQTSNTLGFPTQTPLSTDKSTSQSTELPKAASEAESSSLEMKIHNFLKGNPGFSGLDLNIPILSGLGTNTVSEPTSEFQRGPSSTTLDNVDGTPVRDERSGTPTQDEMMDKPAASSVDTVSLLSKIISPGSSTPSSTRSPLLNKDTDFQKLGGMPPYRPFGIGGNSPNAYLQPPDSRGNPPFIDSSLEKFYPDATFQEDEDYRDFEYSGPPPSAIGNLDKRPSKSILKSNVRSESIDYQPIPPIFSQSQDFGRQSFPPLRSFSTGENNAQLSPSTQMYETYNSLSKLEAPKSPSTPKDDPFFSSDSHNLPGLHSGMSRTPYTDSPRTQNRSHAFTNKNTSRPPMSNMEQTDNDVSATSTIEFKNMLKNASRRPSDENQFNQSGKGNFNEDVKISGLGHTGMTSEERQLQEEHYRIETRVSSCVDLPDSGEEKGAPIETLGYHNSGNMRISGEPIKTVESVRVGVKGNRGLGIDGGRGSWFEMGSRGSPFNDGPSSADDEPSVSGSSGVGGFETQYDEHLPQFQDTISEFRAKSMQAFEHRLPPPPLPPSMVPPLDRGGPFQNEPAGPPSVPPPGLPPDRFSRDMPPHMPPVEAILSHGTHPPPNEHGGNPFSGPPPPEHGANPFSGPPPRDQIGMPFSSPPLDMRNPFSPDHGNIHQSMKDHFGLGPGLQRDLGALPRDHNGPMLGRLNETQVHSRDHLGNFSAPPHHFNAPHHRDNVGGLRSHRPQFRPREQYQSLKRPRPPFARGPPFFTPKRPFYPPRY
ncbi:regulation of nuclear pre-mRNA domain-containing protein 2 isoform X2 [Xenopus tropicalis]|uniref:Regulation of nuclear pre-mRNA domain-containing protein 2 n=1 Tax=Xenopus tropicalis TaxID=8364 RepID=A0A6I8PKD2_XENTR|nr:regulation of nuclear pre-mRNA domain-containing protein 2 isoform X2 [Xenopus tropicalis]|eukprot:XP_004917648.1 PREDICTED: regulation of nuclear pre-mRNA domain-containing protein 2 isoform X2 [Xenopus tropicalis]